MLTEIGTDLKKSFRGLPDMLGVDIVKTRNALQDPALCSQDSLRELRVHHAMAR
jgi:hypothetical protein